MNDALPIVSRIIDSGADWVIEVPQGRARRSLAVSTRVCECPDCSILHLRVSAPDADFRREGEEVLFVDFATRERRLHPLEPGHSTFEPAATRAILGVLRQFPAPMLVERWARHRGERAPGQLPRTWHPWELTAFTEVFPLGWDLKFSTGGRWYLAVDRYCLRPSCSCTEVGVQFLALDDPGSSPSFFVHATLPATRDSVRGHSAGVALWHALLDEIPAKVLRARRRRIRRFANGPACRAALASRFGVAPPPPRGDGPVHRLRVALMGTMPPVWRRIELDGTTPYEDLDRVVRRALGRPDDERSELLAPVALGETPIPGVVGGRPATVAELSADLRMISMPADDEGWWIDVVVEAIVPNTTDAARPRTIDGEGALPPATVPGAKDFFELCRALRGTQAEAQRRAVEVLGVDFDPAEADDEGWVDVALDVDDEPSSPADVARALDAASTVLMDRTREAILDLGDAAVPALSTILQRTPVGPVQDAELTDAMMHAVRLLGELQASAAVERLVELLCTCAPDSLSCIELTHALRAIGAPAYAPLLDAFATTTDDALRQRLFDLAAELPPGDEAFGLLAPVRPTPYVAPARPGRNDSCWCGSGKKYKKCHLATDERST